MPETTVITGGSRGIGRALAERFAADGSDLVLVARSEDRLRAVGERLQDDHGVAVTAAVKDLTNPDAPAELADALEDRDVTVDVLVNNAGIGTYGEFVGIDREADLDQLRLNVTALTDLTKRFLPGMVERDRGGVLNVASMAGFQPGPRMAVYYASKSYVVSLSEALAEEHRGTGVTVTALCPGPVDTGFQDAADMEDSRIGTVLMGDPGSVAGAGYRGFRRGDAIVVPGVAMKALYYGSRLAPRVLTRRVARWANSDR